MLILPAMIIGIDEEKVLLVDLMLHPNLPADDPNEFLLGEFKKIDVVLLSSLVQNLSIELREKAPCVSYHCVQQPTLPKIPLTYTVDE